MCKLTPNCNNYLNEWDIFRAALLQFPNTIVYVFTVGPDLAAAPGPAPRGLGRAPAPGPVLAPGPALVDARPPGPVPARLPPRIPRSRTKQLNSPHTFIQSLFKHLLILISDILNNLDMIFVRLCLYCE